MFDPNAALAAWLAGLLKGYSLGLWLLVGTDGPGLGKHRTHPRALGHSSGVRQRVQPALELVRPGSKPGHTPGGTSALRVGVALLYLGPASPGGREPFAGPGLVAAVR